MDSSAVYAFVLRGNVDWRKSVGADWELDLIELDGSETEVGHRKVEGSICKVLQTSDGKLIALAK